ncbi:uncharacterized mitochondrial protein AtMg00810-like [Rhododendron vialii]|uniref:uncharacterized mitochondrial protein AtMg00810-like n=1 Tax=Rhododendron vialii TaxID=182163 RepID=UPI00265D94E0|nr:uncharacterized mitochondrial protein AtMg00810-like [Rhododendron vialii]
MESIRLLFGIASHFNFKLFQMDVKRAFLNGDLKEEVYVEQPKGFTHPSFPDHVYRLRKALYGLKQAPRAWYERLTDHLLNTGFVKGGVDRILLLKKIESDLLIAQIYVDDIVFGSTNERHAKQFEAQMSHEFQMSLMGELTYFLGFQILQLNDGIFLFQSTYAKELVKNFGLEDSKSIRTPMGSTVKIAKDIEGVCVDSMLYRSMIGSLLYLTASRPNISFSVGVCARYQSNPKESHLIAVKRIIRYIKGTSTLGLWYSEGTNVDLAAFSDANWAGSADDRKSTSGGCFYLGNYLVAWHSKKQNCVSLSTAEEEYIAAVCLVGCWRCLFWVLLWVLGVRCLCGSGAFVGFLPVLDCYSLPLGPYWHMIVGACCFPLWVFSSPT